MFYSSCTKVLVVFSLILALVGKYFGAVMSLPLDIFNYLMINCGLSRHFLI